MISSRKKRRGESFTFTMSRTSTVFTPGAALSPPTYPAPLVGVPSTLLASVLHGPAGSLAARMAMVASLCAGSRVKMSRSRATARPGPMIGQDNERVLKALMGLSPVRYAELVEKRVIY